MQQIIVELDDAMAKRLERVAPAKERKRSEFIREAIRRALNERLEEAMEEAYRRQPQEAVDFDLDPETWEKSPPSPRRPRKRR